MKKLVIDLNGDFGILSGFKQIEFDYFYFGGGEPHFRFKDDLYFYDGDEIHVRIKIKSFNDFGLLMSCVNALDHLDVDIVKKSLFIPYFPAARQDKILGGESFTSKIYTKIINEMNFNKVIILDPHSLVISAMINNVKNITNHKFIFDVLKEIKKRDGKYPVIMSPDYGASKKIDDLMKDILNAFNDYPHKFYLQGKKIREMKTGVLSNFSIEPYETKENILIVDDICDGGGTFIGLREKLSTEHKEVYLAVTHGIFTKGFLELEKYFTFTFSTDSFIETSMSPKHKILYNCYG